jgi:hypothetical protein
MGLSAQLRFCNPVNMKLEIVLRKNYALRSVLYEKRFLFFWDSGLSSVFPSVPDSWAVTKITNAHSTSF